jgi:hypothetical protein
MSDKDRLGPPPIEPMTNAAWSRVERSLFERLDQPAPLPLPAPRARWPWLAVPAFAVAAAAIIAIVLSLRGSAPETQIATPTPSPSPIVPSRVVAGDTPSMVSYGDAHLTVEAHAAIVMDREDRSPSVLVERGAVDFTVAPRQRDPYIVRAGDVVVRVVGTQFRVARYEERVTVAVESGIVDVQFRGKMHRLSAGQSWSSQEQTASNTPAPTNPIVDEPVTPSPDKPAIGSNGKPTAGSNSKPAPTADDLEAAQYRYLSSIERKDFEKAIKGYLALSQGNTKWSANALYAAGRLAFDRKDPRAKTFLDIYLLRFPKGSNAKDARDLLDRLDGANP